MTVFAPLAERLADVRNSPVRDLLALIDRPGMVSFAGGLPAPELFDVDGMRDAYTKVLSGPDATRHLQYAATEGNPQLRAVVAARMTTHGLPTSAEQLLVTTGSQQALTLVASALLDPGAVVAVESPTYLAALQCFSLAGARVVPIASDDQGVRPDDLERVLNAAQPSLVYLVPTFANPTGKTLPLERRRAVVELTARHRCWLVEDDPYSELRYDGEPVAAVAAQPGAEEHVLYMGSFSKTVAPGLRLGWLRAPQSLLRSVTVAKQAADLHTSTIDQAAAAAYLTATDLDRHVSRLVEVYRGRRDAMLATLSTSLPEGSTWTYPAGGMFVWVRLPGSVDSTEILQLAIARHVAFVPGAPFFAGAPDLATLRLSFTNQSQDAIIHGMDRIAQVFAC